MEYGKEVGKEGKVEDGKEGGKEGKVEDGKEGGKEGGVGGKGGRRGVGVYTYRKLHLQCFSLLDWGQNTHLYVQVCPTECIVIVFTQTNRQ